MSWHWRNRLRTGDFRDSACMKRYIDPQAFRSGARPVPLTRNSMPTPDLCTEEEISQLVHAFYAEVRTDEMLGPIFGSHVKNWDKHLATMIDFWSSALRGTARFRGTPMPKHVALPGLSADLFRRWLALFRRTTEAMPNAALRERANDLAGRIAQSLWYGYQLSHQPGVPRELH